MKPFLTFVLDCNDPEALAGFWTAALGYVRLEEGEPIAIGTSPEGGVDGPVLLLQRVPEPKAAKNRMHLDLHTDDLDGEVDRLVGLGARRLAEPQEDRGWCWVVMADPEDNEFCVCRPPLPEVM